MNTVELQQFYDLLIDYARFASGALGASVHDIGRYEAAKFTNLVRKIAEKTGAIDFKNYGGGKSNSSFFNNVDTEYETPSQGNTHKSKYQSIDDLENELG